MKLILLVAYVISCLYTTEGINHGPVADRDKYKYVVAVKVEPTTIQKCFSKDACEKECTGGIIHDKFILTAAHCFGTKHEIRKLHVKADRMEKIYYYTYNKHHVKIHAHTNSSEKLSKGAITVKAKKIHFVANFFRTGNDDIAIIELEKSLHVEGNNKKILQKLEFPKPLTPKTPRKGSHKPHTEQEENPHEMDGYKSYAGAECVIAGYGEDRTLHHYDDGTLRHMKSQIIEYKHCSYDKHTLLCGKAIDAEGNHPKHPLGFCLGDSGAPVVLETHDQKKTVIGVVTGTSHDCDSRDPRNPEGYMRVSHYLDFIDHVIHGKKDNKEYITEDVA